MLILVGQKAFERKVAELHASAMEDVQKQLDGIRTVADLSGKVKQLRSDVEKLEVEKARREEEIARKEREIEHKVGLDRKRAEFEKEKAISDATLAIKQENLSADKKRFADEMKFQSERFTTEVGYLKDLLGQIMQRLPSADIKIERKGR